MKDEDILKLAKLLNRQFIGILKENDLVKMLKTPKSSRSKLNHDFDNMILTQKASKILKSNLPEISDEIVDKFRKLFPKLRNGNKSIIQKKFIRFIHNNPHFTIADIFEVTEIYVKKTLVNSGEQFVKDANNIFYHKPRNKDETSLMFNLLESHFVNNPKKLFGLTKDDFNENDYDDDLN